MTAIPIATAGTGSQAACVTSTCGAMVVNKSIELVNAFRRQALNQAADVIEHTGVIREGSRLAIAS